MGRIFGRKGGDDEVMREVRRVVLWEGAWSSLHDLVALEICEISILGVRETLCHRLLGSCIKHGRLKHLTSCVF